MALKNLKTLGRRIRQTALALALLGAIGTPGRAQQGRFIDLNKDVWMEQKLDAQAPLDTVFRDETGKPVHLGDYFNNGKKPVVLVMPFYRCAGTCTLMLDGMARSFRRITTLKLGQDFDAVTISINPKEGFDLAAAKKKTMIEYLNTENPRPGQEKGWHFLVGQEDQIRRLAQAVGYRYVYDTKTEQYSHPSGLMILTPQGKTSQYLIGTNYPPTDMRLALVDASSSKIGTVIDKLQVFCTSIDPMTGKRGMVVMRLLQVSGTATFLILGSSILLMLRAERRKKNLSPAGANTPTTPIAGSA